MAPNSLLMEPINTNTEPPQSKVPPARVRLVNDEGMRPGGSHVLYWMTACRRSRSNFSLQRAGDWSRHLGLPLVVLSPLRLDYRWATARSHAFIIDSLADLADVFRASNVVHVPHVEQEAGSGEDLLRALAADAAVVITDAAPGVPSPTRLPVRVEAVDHNGLLPLAATDRVFVRAYDLRRFLQKELPNHLDQFPVEDPVAGLPAAPATLLDSIPGSRALPPPSRSLVADLDVDHSVSPTQLHGGQSAGHSVLSQFVSSSLRRYGERNHPDDQTSSGLSPYLHFGNVSAHDVFDAIATEEDWNPGRLGDHASGARQGWWGMSPAAESFLDQVVTWRDLGYRAAALVPNNDAYSALPQWARATLATHASDQREYLYNLEQFDAAETHDEIWNAAQRQLRHEGTIHNYLRMLWGKKILEWTSDPEEAHDIMFELNNRYALDGRDPNSVSGIHWVLGRYDRAWGPERPIFGKVRFMSSDSARRKLRLTNYLGQSKMFST